MFTNRQKYITVILGVFLIFMALSAIYGPKSARGMIPYPIFQKGMTYVTWRQDAFASAKSDESIVSMAKIGVNFVAIVPTWYQDTHDSIEMKPNDRTPSDDSIRHAIVKAHEQNMFVMLKPHIDLIEGSGATRSDIGFQKDEEWNAWFSNYEKFIIHYARIAEAEHVEMLCIGTELAFAASRAEAWRNRIIPKVRKVFSGRITYAANWDDYTEIAFWDRLDYVGIDAYFPLANSACPTTDELRAGWRKWAGEIEKWQPSVNKPIIFTECGYVSADTAALKPWEEASGGSANPALQAECYRVLMEELWDKDWFFGVYWWNWNTYAGSGGPSNKGFTPQNKPATELLKKWYAKLVEKNFIYTGTDQKTAIDMQLNDRLNISGSMDGDARKLKSIGIGETGDMVKRSGRKPGAAESEMGQMDASVDSGGMSN